MMNVSRTRIIDFTASELLLSGGWLFLWTDQYNFYFYISFRIVTMTINIYVRLAQMDTFLFTWPCKLATMMQASF